MIALAQPQCLAQGASGDETEAGSIKPFAPAASSVGGNANRGDANANRGDANASRGDASANAGDANANRGDANANRGDASANAGDANANRGDANANRGDASANRGDANASGAHANTSGVGMEAGTIRPFSPAANSSYYLKPRLNDDDDRVIDENRFFPNTEKQARPPRQKEQRPARSVTELENAAFEAVNTDRTKYGAPPVRRDAKLDAFARHYAQDMAKRKFFSHFDPERRGAEQRAAEFGINSPVYENIGWQAGSGTHLWKVGELERSFMAEPEGQRNHRFNILVPAHIAVGIGVFKTGDQLYLVQEYSDSQP